MAKINTESKVAYNYLGKSGLKVANIGLGCMTFGESQFSERFHTSEDHAHKMLDRYVEWGGNFLDTADNYNVGNSERVIGSWLKKQNREQFVVATKCGFPLFDPTTGLNRRHIVKSIEGSLERLQTDYVDLFQTHIWDDSTPIRETLLTLHDLVRCGKVRYIGVSNVTGWQLQSLVDETDRLGLNHIVSLQQQYSLVSRESELEPFQVCKLRGVGVLPWSPLKGGVLSGKYRRNTRPTEGRIGWATNEAKFESEAWTSWETLLQKEQIWKILDKLHQLADKYGKSVAQVALRWLLQKDVVSSVIVGVTKLPQLDDNMGAANGWRISDQDMTQLDEVSNSVVAYPYQLIRQTNMPRANPFNPSYTVANTSSNDGKATGISLKL